MRGPHSYAMRSQAGRDHLLTALPLCRLVPVIVITAVALVLGNFPSSEALARGRGHHSGHSSAAAAAAKKKQTIQAIQNQVAAARQVLAAAESHAGMTQSQLGEAQTRIEDAKRAFDGADAGGDDSTSKLHAIEEKLLDSVKDDSELGRAEAAVEDAQEALDGELHRILKLPEHEGSLTAEDRQSDQRSLSSADRAALRNDAQYQEKLRELSEAKQKCAGLRAEFLKQNSEWVAAEKARREASREEAKAKQQRTTAAKQAVAAKRQLANAQEVATAARAVIAEGEARLKQLGVKNVGTASNSKPKK